MESRMVVQVGTIIEIVKKEWSGYLQVGINHWFDVGLQMKRQLYTCETSESFLMILVFIL